MANSAATRFRRSLPWQWRHHAAGIALSLSAALVTASAAQARQVGSSVQGLPVCAAYGEFLKGGQPDDFSKCSELGKFLMRNADLDPLRFLIKYQKMFPKASPYEVLIRGLIITIEGDAKKAFFVLDIANTSTYAAYSKVGDDKRAFIYGSLILRLKLLALRAGLGDKASVLAPYPEVDFSALEGPEFAVFDQKPGRPDTDLICLLRTDNIRGPLQQVISSKRFLSCVGAGAAGKRGPYR